MARIAYLVARFYPVEQDEGPPVFTVARREARDFLGPLHLRLRAQLLDRERYIMVGKPLGAYHVVTYGSFDRNGKGRSFTTRETIYVTLPFRGTRPSPHLDAKLAEAAEWAARTFAKRSAQIVEGTASVVDLAIEGRVPWSEITHTFGIRGPDDRNRFQPFFDRAAKRHRIDRLLHERETLDQWAERVRT